MCNPNLNSYDAALILGLTTKSGTVHVNHFLPKNDTETNKKYAELLNKLCIDKKDFNLFKHISTSLFALTDFKLEQVNDIAKYWTSLQNLDRDEPMIKPSKFLDIRHGDA